MEGSPVGSQRAPWPDAATSAGKTVAADAPDLTDRHMDQTRESGLDDAPAAAVQWAERRGRLFVLSGPSGCGQEHGAGPAAGADVPRALVLGFGDHPPAPPGRDRTGSTTFSSARTSSTSLVADGQMLEHAHFAGNHYGTPRGPVEQHLPPARTSYWKSMCRAPDRCGPLRASDLRPCWSSWPHRLSTNSLDG